MYGGKVIIFKSISSRFTVLQRYSTEIFIKDSAITTTYAEVTIHELSQFISLKLHIISWVFPSLAKKFGHDLTNT